MAVGPFSTAHLPRSKLARCPLPPSAVQSTPLRSTSMPRPPWPHWLGSTSGFSNGGSYTSALQVSGGLSPRSSRTMLPGTGRRRAIQIEPSTGFGMIP